MDHLRQTLLDALEYKQNQGSFPASLNKLPGAPARNDPFTDEPLHYRKTANGFVLYSVGEDREDNGGSEKMTEDNWLEDLVVRYP